MAEQQTKKWLDARCSTCGARLPNKPGGYVYSRFTRRRYCIKCCIEWPKKGRGER